MMSLINIEGVDVSGLSRSLIASGYPMEKDLVQDKEYDLDKAIIRASKLARAKGGSGHDCFLKGVHVSFDLTAPQYMWMQAERYTWFDIVSSQSKMHRITEMELKTQCNQFVHSDAIESARGYIHNYKLGLVSCSQMMSNIPMGLMLKARISTNYLQLKTIYFQRKNHRLDEWKEFCDWVETLPMFKKLILGEA